jgi:hypothetical protein
VKAEGLPARVEIKGSKQSIWRRRTDFRLAYVESARAVEEELKLAECEFSVGTLLTLETFSVFEQRLLRAAEEDLLWGSPQGVFELARERKEGFWALQEPNYQPRRVCSSINVELHINR